MKNKMVYLFSLLFSSLVMTSCMDPHFDIKDMPGIYKCEGVYFRYYGRASSPLSFDLPNMKMDCVIRVDGIPYNNFTHKRKASIFLLKDVLDYYPGFEFPEDVVSDLRVDPILECEIKSISYVHAVMKITEDYMESKYDWPKFDLYLQEEE